MQISTILQTWRNLICRQLRQAIASIGYPCLGEKNVPSIHYKFIISSVF